MAKSVPAEKNVTGEVKADNKHRHTLLIDTDVHHASDADITTSSAKSPSILQALTLSGLTAFFKSAQKLVVSRSGTDTPMSIDDFSEAVTPRSSLSLDDQDEEDVKQLADAGISNIILPNLSSDILQSENRLHKSSQALHDFWHETLADAPTVLDLPTDRPRPSPKAQLSVRLEASLTQSLRRLALDHDVDLGIVVMAGWSTVLSRLSGQEDI
ncbi:hypothetical protein BGZ65_000672, partial [Modicella reniformis]